MSEDNEIIFYLPCLGGFVQKGQRKIPNHPDMVLRVLSSIQDFQGPKMAKQPFEDRFPTYLLLVYKYLKFIQGIKWVSRRTNKR